MLAFFLRVQDLVVAACRTSHRVARHAFFGKYGPKCGPVRHSSIHAIIVTAPFGLVNPRASWDWVWGCQKYRGRVPGVPGQKVALPETRPQDRAPSKQCCCIEKNGKHARFSAPADCPRALSRLARAPRVGLGCLPALASMPVARSARAMRALLDKTCNL